MEKFKAYLKENIGWLAAIFCITMAMSALMLLNGAPIQEAGYGLFVCAFIAAVAALAGYGRHFGSFQQLEEMKKSIAEGAMDLKFPEYMYEEQYQDCIRAIAKEKNKLQNELLSRQQDMSEYYSMWVHQIKTPIAALKLLMDEEIAQYFDTDSLEENEARMAMERQKQQQLFQIEQYVDMALQYTRLGAEAKDLVIQKASLDEVIKSSIHKYAKQFIHKGLRLAYTPQDITAVTDKKWLGFVIDQLLSNAIKYTKQGAISIWVGPTEEPHPCQLVQEPEPTESPKPWYERIGDVPSEERISIIIEDTGIGISQEDIPRVCEKGYTGYNGHANKYSTGIGLYLCRRILDRLGHKLVITSQQGKGTRVEIILIEDGFQ